LGDKSARLKPFVGAGLGFKTFPVKKFFESSVVSFYGTGGVDLKLSDSFSVTGAINIPIDSAYGTEYQVGISFFNF
jgi:outer membrane protein W